MESVYTLGGAGGAARTVSVLPPDHFEWQPPQSSAVAASWPSVWTVRIRDPESSIGANDAPQAPQRCSCSDLVRFNEIVRVGIPSS